MKRVCLYFFSVLFFLSCKTKQITEEAQAKSDSVFVVAFGSCNRQNEENPFWDDVLNENPDVWIWGGDNIYADTDDMALLQSMYTKQKADKGYQSIRENMPVIGTWDDHDYGRNDGGVEFEMKQESQQLFLDFFEVPANDARRKREGVYTSHDFMTPAGEIKVLVVDTRYFRSPLLEDSETKKRYKINPSEEATVLGAEQWQWLEEELNSSKAEFNLIVTSIQFLSWEHGFETWGNFPNEVKKLKSLIVESGAKGVIILSGDRHISEFSKTNLDGLSYPLMDFTSSGLTHSYTDFTSEPNGYRVGDVVSVQSFGLIHLDVQKKEAHFKIMGENGKVFQELKQTY
nr:alkaline phosphatase D family protein [Allomuricauda sp.]